MTGTGFKCQAARILLKLQRLMARSIFPSSIPPQIANPQPRQSDTITMTSSYKYIGYLITSLVILMAGCTTSPESADQIITNAVVWTGSSLQPYAGAVAIHGDRILAVGDAGDMARYRSENTQLTDAGGAFITPGFIDSHIHFLTGGFRLSSVQLRDASTPEEFADRIRDFAATLPAGTWITGGDWDHENWGGELPDRQWIDRHTPDHPVWVNRLDGHMALANSAALRAAGLNDSAQDIPGGEMVRDSNGRLTGILKDNAMYPVNRVVPPPTAGQEDAALRSAMNYVASHGVTSVHDVNGTMDVFDRFHASGELITRIYASMPLTRWQEAAGRIRTRGSGDEWLRTGGVKGFMDGSLGSHTAAFLEPYDDTPGDAGFLVIEPDTILGLIRDADEAGLQMLIHAIGDLAIRELLDIFEQVAGENGPRDRRFRIEHAQHIAPVDISRFAELGVIASMQPYHAIDDGRWAGRYIGDRIATTYAFRSLADANAHIAFGSDWFVAPPTPLEGIYAAVTRRTLDGANPDGWVPEQKITVEEALRFYTREGAYASFEEELKGTIEPGKLADLVFIDRNLTETDPVQIRDAQIVRTMVGGKTVYTSSENFKE
jgi:predicted amidohydrolase YtcJ